MIWGAIIDKLSFKLVYFIIIFSYGMFAWTFPYVSSSYLGFASWYIIMGIFWNGSLTVVGPALTKLFGMIIGSKLFPIRTSAIYIALLIFPLLS